MRDTPATETDDDDTDRSRIDSARRNVLRALGAGTAVAATSGVASAGVGGGGRLFSADDDTADAEIDPQFGFAAASGDVEPPVEPDHEIRVLIQPREGAPIPEFFFDPVGLFVEPGDTVKWNFVTGHHSVTAYHPGFGYQQRVPDGVPPYSSPLMPQGGYWLYTFQQEGVYDYHCAPHEIFGHVGRIVCGSAKGFQPIPDLCAAPPSEGGEGEGGADGEGGDGENGENGEGGGGEPELRLPAFTGYTVLRDDSLTPECIVEKGAQPWTKIDPENKRLFLRVEGFPPCGEE
ncbi:plastocyanin/azurin family copper-binding protein [Halobium salinum]|uniref:Plastocyanin/azurin family copper-binding protein n=1 Tax=Halobium salinum TaxID=1364940 RepID=A0ABD5PAU6_9EURY|nr:plastocyanin/azurin family copper-binding protein [Halobium salinum]